jgi:tight adherence protein C
MDWAIVVLAGLCVAGVVWVVLSIVFSEERGVRRRLKQLSEHERATAGEVEPLTKPFYERVVQPGGQGFSGLLRRFMPRPYLERGAARLRTAGNPGGLTVDLYMAIRVVLFVASGGFFFLVSLLFGAGLVWAILLGLFTGIVAYLVPELWLNHRISKRKDAIRRALPDMLDMLMISVEAGLGFSAAVAKYVRNSDGPLADEFAVALSEMQAGLTRRVALRNLADRCDVTELNAFVMAMVQADVFGVAVSNVLRTQSREMRVKRRQRAEEIAQRAPAKMVFPLVLCILPATLIVLGGPAIIAIGRAFGLIAQ